MVQVNLSQCEGGTLDPPQVSKVANVVFTTELFYIILRDIRLWEQLMRLVFVLIKNENKTQSFIFHFSISKKNGKLNIDFHFSFSMFRKK